MTPEDIEYETEVRPPRPDRAPARPLVADHLARSAANGGSFVIALLALTAVMLGSTLPTPLYSIYAIDLNFGVATTTLVYAIYAAGVVSALIAFGRWSDVIGRRPLLIAGALLSVASATAFITAGSVWQLLIGRVLSGLSVGVYAGAATSAVIDLAPSAWRERAPVFAAAANLGGLSLGPLAAGLLAEFAPAPRHLPFALNLVLLGLVLVGIWLMKETVHVVPDARLSVQRLSLPPEVRGVFARASTAAFAGFAVIGTFTGVAPSLISDILGVKSPAVTGVIVAVLLFVPAITQIFVGLFPSGHSTERALAAGCAILLTGTLIVIIALLKPSLTIFIVGAVVCGVGQGLSFSRGLAALVAASPDHRRSEVTSSYFVVAYIAISVPVIGQGLIAASFGLRFSAVVFNIASAGLAFIALLLAIVAVRRSRTARLS